MAHLPEYTPVLIVGAGISGLGAAAHLKAQCPGRDFCVIDSKTDLGGTWLTHRYPGVRSDSDLYTYGYRFKPWRGKPIAEGPLIMNYLRDMSVEHHLGPHLFFGWQLTEASWCSTSALWRVRLTEVESGQQRTLSCQFLWMCQGYYRHDTPNLPDFPGRESFKGPIIHPQDWPDDLELKGKRVIVIGSGATAATLIPNIADDCEQVTMLQRSPAYFYVGGNRNELAEQLDALDIPPEWTHEITRRQLLKDQQALHQVANEYPEVVAEELINGVQAILGEDFDVDSHFRPAYRPWQQRIAYLPDGDLFHAIARGDVNVVTAHIDRFEANGIRTTEGNLIPADIVISATGFQLSVMGDVAFDVDGVPVDFGQCHTYLGIMISDVPNMAAMFGYLRTSWTMRVDLVSDFVCRLLNTLEEDGLSWCMPSPPEAETIADARPWIAAEDFSPGYLHKSIHKMPKQGSDLPWINLTDYYVEREVLPTIDLKDGALLFGGSR